MVEFATTILKFDEQGEKTGWCYIEITSQHAEQLSPGNKKSFRVKGCVDEYAFEGVSFLPMGGGNFIIPMNATIRKNIHKGKGAIVNVKLQLDEKPFALNEDLMACLADEPKALSYFKKLPGSHQKYYSKWIEGSKTEATKARRIALTIAACARNMHFGEMMREQKAKHEL